MNKEQLNSTIQTISVGLFLIYAVLFLNNQKIQRLEDIIKEKTIILNILSKKSTAPLITNLINPLSNVSLKGMYYSMSKSKEIIVANGDGTLFTWRRDVSLQSSLPEKWYYSVRNKSRLVMTNDFTARDPNIYIISVSKRFSQITSFVFNNNYYNSSQKNAHITYPLDLLY